MDAGGGWAHVDADFALPDNIGGATPRGGEAVVTGTPLKRSPQVSQSPCSLAHPHGTDLAEKLIVRSRFWNPNTHCPVACEVFAAVVMNSPVFWDIRPCGPLKVSRRFGRTCRLHLQGRKMSQTRNEHEAELDVMFQKVHDLVHKSVQ
jgi:hypothetical protein